MKQHARQGFDPNFKTPGNHKEKPKRRCENGISKKRKKKRLSLTFSKE